MLETLLRRHLAKSAASRVLDALDSLDPDNLLPSVLSALASDVLAADPLPQVALAAEAERAARLAAATEQLRSDKAKLSPAVVVAGLPRTGSTLLQQQLAVRTSSSGTPLGWEYSIERIERLVADGSDLGVEQASREISEQYDSLAGLNPAVHALHPLGPVLPEECTPAFRSSGLFMPWLLLFDSPSAQDILLTDLASGRSLLPHRHWAKITYLIGRGGGSVLKSPLHTAYLAGLRSSVADDTQIVVVRRDAESVLRSFAELAFHVRATVYAADPIRTGQVASAILTALCRGFESANSPGAVAVIEFDDLVADPPGVARRILGGRAGRPGWDLEDGLSRPHYPSLPAIDRGQLEILRSHSATLLS